MTRRWLIPALFLLCGSLLAAGSAFGGGPGPAAGLLAVFVPLAVLHSPLVFPRSLGVAQARRRSAADGRPVVLWRPGCKYCLRLRFRLGRDARRVHWVDIWRDPEAAAAAREVNDGNETVPTVFVAGGARTNPPVEWVRAQLAGPAGEA
ncbi:mycoredoxin [Kitasatospora sp. Ki12]|uniref:glutaredoxin domain-containing protein n=1 Tax=Kitasatospora xanthocidica TaxID=83382 RepID=UPI0016752E8E|nr:glutaredoxin domain-containing protein [Kitasatospora xanthocidica]GHF86631.1 membrane protein [Kitasatospora xanthocidica]